NPVADGKGLQQVMHVGLSPVRVPDVLLLEVRGWVRGRTTNGGSSKGERRSAWHFRSRAAVLLIWEGAYVARFVGSRCHNHCYRCHRLWQRVQSSQDVHATRERNGCPTAGPKRDSRWTRATPEGRRCDCDGGRTAVGGPALHDQ